MDPREEPALLYDVPARACDCHMHVFGDQHRYPLSLARAYTPRIADFPAYEALQKRLGFERVVFVQPSVYGTDNSCMLDAMKTAGANARGVVVIDMATPESSLEAMNRTGVRGVRLNAASGGKGDRGQFARELVNIASRIDGLGWNIQLFAGLAMIEAAAERIAALSQPVVIDHMGLAVAAKGPDQPGFSTLLELLRAGHVWVKLSAPYRISEKEADFADADSIVAALVEANPDRLLWGSDWPHTPKHGGVHLDGPVDIPYRNVDARHLLGQLMHWIGNRDIVRRVLVDNPAALYDYL